MLSTGTLYISWILFATITTALLASRKTSTPYLTTFFGILLAWLPPLSLIFLLVLVLKNDIKLTSTDH